MSSDDPTASTEDATRYDIPLPAHVREMITADWDPAPSMPHPARADGAPWQAKRRESLSAAFRGRPVVIPAGPLRIRSNDTDYPFRAHSAFTWLTGETVEGAVLVLSPQGDGHVATLYVRRYSGPGEVGYFASRSFGAVWVGNVPTVQETQEHLQVATRPLADLPDDLRRLPGNVAVLRGVDPSVDALLPGAADPAVLQTLDELRLIKDEWEVERLRDACDVTARGFADVARELPMLLTRPDVRGERWLEGTFWRRARTEGNEVGYTSILASGEHATVLHWWRNHGVITPGSLLLADMGVETDELYTADVTRTMPVSGEWSPAQLQVYRAVAEAQQAGVDQVRAGADFLSAHRAAMWVLSDHLHRWGILVAPPEVTCHPDPDRPGSGLHRRYTLHGTSHMLGIDVHDCASAREENYRETKLRAGHALTVEPGLYFQPNDRTVPPELRGIGVRIEDDVVVTDTGSVNLSAGLPRDPDEIVAWMRDVQAAPAAP